MRNASPPATVGSRVPGRAPSVDGRTAAASSLLCSALAGHSSSRNRGCCESPRDSGVGGCRTHACDGSKAGAEARGMARSSSLEHAGNFIGESSERRKDADVHQPFAPVPRG